MAKSDLIEMFKSGAKTSGSNFAILIEDLGIQVDNDTIVGNVEDLYDRYIPIATVINKWGLSTPTSDTDFWGDVTVTFAPTNNGFGQFTETEAQTDRIQRVINIKLGDDAVNLEPSTGYTAILDIQNNTMTNLAESWVTLSYDGWTDNIFDGNVGFTFSDTSIMQVRTYATTLESFSDVMRFEFDIPANETGSIEFRLFIIKGDLTGVPSKVVFSVEDPTGGDS